MDRNDLRGLACEVRSQSFFAVHLHRNDVRSCVLSGKRASVTGVGSESQSDKRRKNGRKIEVETCSAPAVRKPTKTKLQVGSKCVGLFSVWMSGVQG
jgi:hypothetical protein